VKLISVENNRFFKGQFGFLGSLAQSILARHLVSRNNSTQTIFLIPEALREKCKKHNLACISWDELTLKADFHHETLSEFHDFIGSTLKILCSQMDGELAEEVLRLTLLSPLADDLPFFLTGFDVLVRELKINTTEIVGGTGVWSVIAEEVSKAGGIKVNFNTPFSLRLFSLVNLLLDKVIQIRAFAKTIGTLFSLREYSAQELQKLKGGILYACPKDRTAPFVLPISEKIPSLPQIFVFPICPAITPMHAWEFAISVLSMGKTGLSLVLEYLHAWRKVGKVWKRQEYRIIGLNAEYRKFSIFRLYGPTVRNLWFSEATSSVLLSRRMDHLFEALQPKAVVAFDPLPIGSLLLSGARKRKTLAVIYYAFFNGLESAQSLIESCYPGMADVYLVINEWMRERLKRIALSPSAKVVAVGDVRMSVSAKNEAASSLGPIVFCSRPTGSVLTAGERAMWIKTAAAAAAQIRRPLKIKPHPYEDRNELFAFCDSNTDLVTKGVPNTKIFGMAGLVIAPAGSSVAMEAFYLRVPVILYGSDSVMTSMDNLGGSTAYRRFGGGLSITEPEELTAAIAKLLHDTEFRKKNIEGGIAYAERMYGPPDGLAPERFAEAVKNEMKKFNA
jgi:hypothetical protein